MEKPNFNFKSDQVKDSNLKNPVFVRFVIGFINDEFS